MGLNANDVYQGDFIKANSDGTIGIEGNPTSPILTIGSEFSTKEFDDKKKQIIISFKETDMTLGLNKGNMQEIANFTGSADTDKWVGVKIQLTAVRDDSGKSKTGKRIVVSVPRDQGSRAASPAAGPVMGKEAADRLTKAVDAMSDRGFVFADLTGYLKTADAAPQELIWEHPEKWPRSWGTKVKHWLDNPFKAIGEEDIPF